MLENYMKVTVSGVPVYLFHENMESYKPYLTTEGRLNSFEDLLIYCQGHGITLSFELPPKKESKKVHRNMLKMVKEYPDTIMSVTNVRNLVEGVAEATGAENYRIWLER
jgi:hypothetical protein